MGRYNRCYRVRSGLVGYQVMKATHAALLLLTLAAAAGVSAQTITGYGVTKVYNGSQTSAVSGLIDSSVQPHAITAYVNGSGLAGTYSFTPASGSEIGIAKNLTITGGATSAQFEQTFTSGLDLNNAYGNNSAYGMAIPNSTAFDTATLPAFPAVDAYPDEPLISGGTWVGGLLQIDPTQNYTLTFSSFASFVSDDSYGIKIEDSGQSAVTSGFWNTAETTTFLITAGTLTAGQIYTADLRFNNNFINYNNPFAGANGNVGYTISNTFQIQAIPEPSTYAAIFGVLALAGVMIRRRRRAA